MLGSAAAVGSSSRRSGHLGGAPPWWAALSVTVVVVAVLGWLGRHWWFLLDEWGTASYRRSGGDTTVLAPHNGHLEAVPVLVYRVLFATTGLRSYAPYRAVLLVVLGVTAVALTAYTRQRVRSALALLVVPLGLLVGPGWEVTFWPVNIGFLLPWVGYLVTLALWDRPGQRRPRGEAAVVGVLAVVALASSSLGVATVVGLLVEAVARRSRPRRLRVAALVAALGLWLLWFTAYRPHARLPAALLAVPGADPRGDLGASPVGAVGGRQGLTYVVGTVHASAIGLFGAVPAWQWGRVLGWVGLALLAAALAWTTLSGRADRARVLGLAVVAVVFWAALAVARADQHDEAASRYVFTGALLLLLLGVEVGRAVATPAGSARPVRAGRAVAAVGLAVAVAVLAVDVRDLVVISRLSIQSFARMRGELAAVECSPSRYPPAAMPDPVLLYGLRAGPYLGAVHDLGSPTSSGCPAP